MPGTGDPPRFPSTRARDTRECWLTLGALGHMRESPETALRHPSPRTWVRVARDSLSTPQALGAGPSHGGQLVEPLGIRTRVQRAWGSCLTPGPSGTVRVAKESWSTVRTIGPERNRPGRAGRTVLPSDPSASRPGELVDPTGPLTRVRSTGTAVRPRGTSEPCLVARDIWSSPRSLGPGPEWTGTAGGPRAPSESSASHPGQLVDPQALGPKRE